jgi:hypothetical protein
LFCFSLLLFCNGRWQRRRRWWITETFCYYLCSQVDENEHRIEVTFFFYDFSAIPHPCHMKRLRPIIISYV